MNLSDLVFFFFVFSNGSRDHTQKKKRHGTWKIHVVVCHRHRKNKNPIKIHLKGRTTTVSFSFSLSREASHTHSECSRADNNNNNPSTLLYVSTSSSSSSSSAAAANYPHTHSQQLYTTGWQRLSIRCGETTRCCFPATAANIRDRVVDGKGCVRVCVCPRVLFLLKLLTPPECLCVLVVGLFKFIPVTVIITQLEKEFRVNISCIQQIRERRSFMVSCWNGFGFVLYTKKKTKTPSSFCAAERRE